MEESGKKWNKMVVYMAKIRLLCVWAFIDLLHKIFTGLCSYNIMFLEHNFLLIFLKKHMKNTLFF